jgi:hypothetical protein
MVRGNDIYQRIIILHIGHAHVAAGHPDTDNLLRYLFYSGSCVLNLAVTRESHGTIKPFIIMHITSTPTPLRSSKDVQKTARFRELAEPKSLGHREWRGCGVRSHWCIHCTLPHSGKDLTGAGFAFEQAGSIHVDSSDLGRVLKTCVEKKVNKRIMVRSFVVFVHGCCCSGLDRSVFSLARAAFTPIIQEDRCGLVPRNKLLQTNFRIHIPF